MSDGADLGIKAEDALKTILGGEEPVQKKERMTPEEVREYLLSCPDSIAGLDYSDSSRFIGREFLKTLESDPTALDLGLRELWDRSKERCPELVEIGPTGFMVGWAANAARYALKAAPVPNPAIVEIDV